MSTKLTLAVNSFNQGEQKELGIHGDILRRVDNKTENRQKYRELLENTETVTVGSTRYKFAEQLPNVLGDQNITVTEDLIKEVKSLAAETDDGGKDSYVDPQKEEVIEFLRRNLGSKVFVTAHDSS